MFGSDMRGLLVAGGPVPGLRCRDGPGSLVCPAFAWLWRLPRRLSSRSARRRSGPTRTGGNDKRWTRPRGRRPAAGLPAPRRTQAGRASRDYMLAASIGEVAGDDGPASVDRVLERRYRRARGARSRSSVPPCGGMLRDTGYLMSLMVDDGYHLGGSRLSTDRRHSLIALEAGCGLANVKVRSLS
jgi:hypothetical protein